MTWWALLLLAWGLSAALQLGLWLWQRRTGSATVVDVGWAGSLAGMAVLYAILGQGGLEHRLLVGITGGLAFGRLTWMLAKRVSGAEDPRYVELRRRWREHGDVQRRLLVFFQAQALAATLLSLPLLAAAYNDRRPRVARMARARRVAGRRLPRSGCRPAAGRLPARRRGQRTGDRRRRLALLARPELLRPVAHVVRVRAHRPGRPVGMGRPALAGADAVPDPLRDGHPAARAAPARDARRGLPELPERTSAFVPLPPRGTLTAG